MTQNNQTARQIIDQRIIVYQKKLDFENGPEQTKAELRFAIEALKMVKSSLQVAPASEDVPIKDDGSDLHTLAHEAATAVWNAMTRRASPPAFMDMATEAVRKFIIDNCLQRPAPQPLADVSEDERARAIAGLNWLTKELDEQWEYCDLTDADCYEYEKAVKDITTVITRAKSDERVVSREDAKAALQSFQKSRHENHRRHHWIDDNDNEEIVLALLTAAAGAQK